MINENSRAATDKCILELKPPRLLKLLEKTEFYTNIINVAQNIELLLDRIPEVFPNYTLHNIDHSIRVMEYMYDLILDIKKLSNLEIAMLIYAALLHDVGMYVTSEEVIRIKNDDYQGSDDRFKAMLKYYKNNEQRALQDYVRKIHAERSANYVRNTIKNTFYLPSQPATMFFEELALICEGHTKDASWLQHKLKSSYGEKGKYHYNTLYCALLLRLGDILDIDSQRTPPSLYDILNLDGISDDEWRQHFIIENERKIKNDEEGKPYDIVLYGKCTDARIHRKVLSYIDWISSEICNAVKITKVMDSGHQLKINSEVQNFIETVGFAFSNFKLNVDFKAITALLMGEKIYGSKKLGLRELIQNSIDACKVRKEIEDQTKEYYDDDYIPTIKVILDNNNNKVIIRDNGKGMSMEILKKYFLNVGVSYYGSNDFLFKNYKYKPIGAFGIGFLAAFMLSSEVIVKTRHYNETNSYKLMLTKGSEYISLEEQEDARFNGTEIILNYSEFIQAMGDNVENVSQFLSNYFLTDGIDLELILADKKDTRKISNPLHKPSHSKGHYINLADYLVDIDGYIHVEVNKKIHGANLDDVSYLGDAYYYDGKSLTLIDDPSSFDLEQLYNDYSIKFLEIPIVTDSFVEDYEKIYEILNDKEDTLNKLTEMNTLDWITIFLSKNNHEQISNSTIISSFDNIIDNISFSDIVEFGQDDSVPTKVYVNDFRNYYDVGRRFFLPFKDKEDIPFSFEISRYIYIRNVLVSNSTIKIENFLSCIKIQGLRINVFNENLSTDLSRNMLTPETQRILTYAISKTLHLWALENLDLPDDKINALKDFLKTFYNTKNILMKESYNILF